MSFRSISWGSVVVRLGEEGEEFLHGPGRAPGGLDPRFPFAQGTRMHPPPCFPSFDVGQRDGEVFGVLFEVRGNPPPMLGAVFAPEMMVVAAENRGF